MAGEEFLIMENNRYNQIEIRDRKIIASRDSESQCLGLCLKNKDHISVISGILRPEDFYYTENQHIFRTILSLFNNNSHIDEITVADDLNINGLLEAAKGRVYINALKDIATSSEKVKEYAERVRDWSALRQIVESNENTIEKIKSGDPVNATEIISDQARGLFNISDRLVKGDFVSTHDLHSGLHDTLRDAYVNKKDLLGVSSGFTNLDYLTGGFQAGDFVVVAARPGVGKTSFSIQVASYCATELKIPAAIFSLEMKKEILMYRLLSMEARVNSVKMRRGEVSNVEWKRINEALEKYKESPLLIDDAAGSTMMEIKSKTNKLLQKYGKLGLVVIDYFDMIRSTSKDSEGHARLAQTSMELKEFAKVLPCPVILVARLNRAGESRKDRTPVMTDIGGSDKVAYDADSLIFLYRPAYHEQKKEYRPGGLSQGDNHLFKTESPLDDDETEEEKYVKLILEKNRNGPTGALNFEFEKKYSYFKEKR